jgi:hypothetical protein
MPMLGAGDGHGATIQPAIALNAIGEPVTRLS